MLANCSTHWTSTLLSSSPNPNMGHYPINEKMCRGMFTLRYHAVRSMVTGRTGRRRRSGGGLSYGLGLTAGARSDHVCDRCRGSRHRCKQYKRHTHTRDTGIGPTPAFVRAGFGNRVLKGPSANACMHRPIGPLLTSDREIGASSSAISATALARARGPHIGRAADSTSAVFLIR